MAGVFSNGESRNKASLTEFEGLSQTFDVADNDIK